MHPDDGSRLLEGIGVVFPSSVGHQSQSGYGFCVRFHVFETLKVASSTRRVRFAILSSQPFRSILTIRLRPSSRDQRRNLPEW